MSIFADLVVECSRLRPGSVPSVFAERREGIKLLYFSRQSPVVMPIQLLGASVSLPTAASSVAGPEGDYAERTWLAWADGSGETGFSGSPPDELRTTLEGHARDALAAGSPLLTGGERRSWPDTGELARFLSGLPAELTGGRKGQWTLFALLDASDQAVVAGSPGYAGTGDLRSNAFGVVAALLEADGDAGVGAALCRPAGSSLSDITEALLQAGREAADRAEATLDGVHPAAGSYQTVWDGTAAGQVIHEALGHALEARHGPGGVLAGKLGRRVGAEDLTVVDDPTDREAAGTYTYDDEGVPAERTVLIDEGVLTSYLHDRGTALAHRTLPNGHARRGSFRVPAMARMSSTLGLGGSAELEELIAEIKDGLLVTGVMGGRAAVYSGSFRVIVTEGRFVRGGKVAEPVKNFLVKASIEPANLLRYRLAASPSPPMPGSCGLTPEQTLTVSTGAPAMLVPGVVVARPLETADVVRLFQDPGYSLRLLDEI